MLPLLHHGMLLMGLLADLGAGAEEAEVVVGKARADDEDAFVAQRGEGAAEGEVFGGRVAPAERDLEQGDAGVRVHDVSRDEGAVVVALLRVQPHGQARGLDQVMRPLCEIRRPGGLVLDLEGMRGKPVVIVDHRRVRGGHDGEAVVLPVAGDHQDGHPSPP